MIFFELLFLILFFAGLFYLAYNRNTLADAGICPNCGAELVERQGRYGYFIGCSRYPKCKFTTK